MELIPKGENPVLVKINEGKREADEAGMLWKEHLGLGKFPDLYESLS